MELNQDELPTFRLHNVTNNEILFKDVYYNGFHSLQQLEIENLTQDSISIELDSTINDQLFFQLENENIKDLQLPNIATNTAAWATFTAPQRVSQFNQVFNYVNHTKIIDLVPNQKTQIIVSFLPSQEQQDNINIFTLVEGIVFFRSKKFNLNVNIRATVCQSILAADELNTGLIFEDSLVGETYMKDVKIRNLSAIDLHWKLNTLDLLLLKSKPSSSSSSSNGSQSSASAVADEWLQFVDASTFITLDHDHLPPIPPFSYFIFRVIFTPKEAGKFNYDLQIENVNDVRNIIHAKIHATMRTIVHRDTLVVRSGNVLDFGDCVAGTWNKQEIVLNNISETPIEIHFVADGAELGFDVMMNTEELDQNIDSLVITESYISTNTSTFQLSSKPVSSVDISSSRSSVAAGGGNGGHLSPSSHLSTARPESPTTSHKTYGSAEECLSTASYTSTDIENIDMLTAFNNVYSANDATDLMNFTASSITQVAITTTEQCSTKIEDIVLKPGAERIIQVSYRPEKDAEHSVNAGQLKGQNFNIILKYSPNKSAKPKELKLIQCKARSCTSIVQVTPQFIDFGDTDVGTQKSIPVIINNLSEICAQVELVFESKVLNCAEGELLIQPKNSIEIKLDIYPRKVNSSYKRQIKLVNYLNRDNDQIIEVSSKNVDKNRVTFHSLFYRILTPTGANFLDFGPIALNSTAIRTCTLVNVRDASLLLGIAASSKDEIVIYTKRRHQSRKAIVTPSAIENVSDQHWAAHTVTDTLMANNRRTRVTNVQYTSTAYLDLANVPHKRILSSIKYKRNIARNLKTHEKSGIGSHKEQKNDTATTIGIEKLEIVKDIPSENKTSTVTKSTISTCTETTSTRHQYSKFFKKKKTKACVGITGTTSHSKREKKRFIDWPDIAGKSRVPLDDLISILEYGSLSRTPLFAKQSLEEQFVRYQLAWRTELDRLIEKGELVPTTLLQLNPKEEEEIIVVYSPKTSSESLTSKNAASISFRLIDFDQSAITTSEEEEGDEHNILTKAENVKQRQFHQRGFIPVLRKVIVRAQFCKSVMELGQRNINFGIVSRGERLQKTIILHNKSETPLLYTIKRSGSIASGDIHFGAGRHGVIRAFGKREIEFTFVPTLPGTFMEQLEVINIRDKEDRNTISLKAMVRRPESFSIKYPLPEIKFSACLMTEITQQEAIVVTNTGRQPRMFEVKVVSDDVHHKQLKIEFKIIHDHQKGDTLILSKEEEEEIENLEQKLKIATRKNQLDKVKKYRNKLAKLKKNEEDLSNLSPDEFDPSSTEDEKPFSVEQKEHTSSGHKEIVDEDRILFFLEPYTSKSISMRFTTVNIPHTEGEMVDPSSFHGNGHIMVHEHKNVDIVKTIPFTVDLCREHKSCLVDKIL